MSDINDILKNRFICHKYTCLISRTACIKRQDKAETLQGKQSNPLALMDRDNSSITFCLDCKQGKAIREGKPETTETHKKDSEFLADIMLHPEKYNITTVTHKKEDNPLKVKETTKPIKPVNERVRPTVNVDFRNRPDVLEKVEMMAREEDRSISSQIVNICKRFLEREAA